MAKIRGGERYASSQTTCLECGSEERTGGLDEEPTQAIPAAQSVGMLLVAKGKAAYEVAQDRRVHAHRVTVSDWIEKFQTHGFEGLKQAKGQGRKPRFFPSPQE